MVHISLSSTCKIKEMLRILNGQNTVDQNLMGKSLGGGDISQRLSLMLHWQTGNGSRRGRLRVSARSKLPCQDTCCKHKLGF